MNAFGMNYIRFVDDILVFADNEYELYLALDRISQILDRPQRLTLQRHKTELMTSMECQSLCSKMVEDRPINSDEKSLIELIRKYSSGDPYISVSFATMKGSDLKKISEEKISSIIEEYLDQDEPDYIRLRWFYRRLAQVGHPGAIKISISRINSLFPCLANLCFYFSSVQTAPLSGWKDIGRGLLDLLRTRRIEGNEYFRISILSLFSIIPDLDHFQELARMYESSDSGVRREILLAAHRSNAQDWIRLHKDDFDGMDPWQKRAFIIVCSSFTKDERSHYLGRKKFERPLENTIKKWSKG